MSQTNVTEVKKSSDSHVTTYQGRVENLGEIATAAILAEIPDAHPAVIAAAIGAAATCATLASGTGLIALELRRPNAIALLLKLTETVIDNGIAVAKAVGKAVGMDADKAKLVCLIAGKVTFQLTEEGQRSLAKVADDENEREESAETPVIH